MSNSLVTRYTYGNSGWLTPLSYAAASFNREGEMLQITRRHIEAQKSASREISKSSITAAHMICAEIDQQTDALESALDRMGDKLSSSISSAADQVSNAISEFDRNICFRLDEMLWQQAQQSESLEKILDVLRQSRSNEAQQLLKQGLRHYLNKEYNEAEERFIKALDYDTTDYQILMNLGFIEIHKGDAAKAHIYFNKALTLPESLDSASRVRTLWAIAKLFYAQEDYMNAYRFAIKALPEKPTTDPKGMFTSGIYAALAGIKGEALVRIKVAIRRDSKIFVFATIEPEFTIIKKEVLEMLSNMAEDASKKANDRLKELYSEFAKITLTSGNDFINDSMKKLQVLLNDLDKRLQNPSFSDCINSLTKLAIANGIPQFLKKLDTIESRLNKLYKERRGLENDMQSAESNQWHFDTNKVYPIAWTFTGILMYFLPGYFVYNCLTVEKGFNMIFWPLPLVVGLLDLVSPPGFPRSEFHGIPGAVWNGLLLGGLISGAIWFAIYLIISAKKNNNYESYHKASQLNEKIKATNPETSDLQDQSKKLIEEISIKLSEATI